MYYFVLLGLATLGFSSILLPELGFSIKNLGQTEVTPLKESL